MALSASASAAPLPLDLAAKLFGARPSAFAPDLSPSGNKIVYMGAAEGPANVVVVLDLKTKQSKTVIGSAGKPDSIDWCEFATDDWIVCHIRADVPFRASILGVSRLIAIDLNTGKTKGLGVEPNVDTAATVHQSDGYVISYPDDGQPSVIMARNYVQSRDRQGLMGSEAPPVSLGVDRIDLSTMKVTKIEAPDPLAESFLAGPDGKPRVRMRSRYDSLGQLSGINQFQFRAPGSNNWQELSTYDSRSDVGAYPIAVDAASNQVYMVRKKDGRDALYRQTLERGSQLVEVASNAHYDIDGVVRLSRAGPIVGYAYTDDRPKVVFFDPAYNSLVSTLVKAVPQTPMIYLSGVSRDRNKFLVHAASERDPGAYYVYDRNARKLDFALEVREALVNVPLAPMRRVDVPTADGHSIPAYITAAEGRSPNGPAIVLPHGGPSSRDALGFDWLAQFLAARGYAVIQPNYRGSAGYGEGMLGENAFKDWKTAISDIGASADYLAKQGIADPARIAILGWSYGGYAALQSAVTSPDKYKAVVAIAPVTDLSRLGKDDREFTSANLTTDFIGKGDNLRDGSPLQHAELIKAPVLLVHGDLDRNVRVSHSKSMEKAIRSAGGRVEFLEFKDLNHQLSDSDARAQMLSKIGELLDRTIGH